MYKQEAQKEGYIPIPPKELFPDNPEQGYLDDGTPYLADSMLEEQGRAKYQQLMQQAEQVQLIQIRQDGDCWSMQTTRKEFPTVPVNDEFRRLASAPKWMKLEPCGVNFAGIFLSQDVFVFLDNQGNMTGSLSIGLDKSLICKPAGQNHYDKLRKQMLKALGLGE